MRLHTIFSRPLISIVLSLPSLAGHAQSAFTVPNTANSAAVPTRGAPGQAAVQGVTDPVVASVEGRPIYLSELGRASLPENVRGLPFDVVYPALLDRMIDHTALVTMARRSGLEASPQVRREIQAATEKILEGAYLGQEVAPRVTEQAIQARYDLLYGAQPVTDEVRARHILVATEAEARKVLENLRQGTDFATMARSVSKDADASKGGDLGFFRRDQVWPGFADLAFALSPGQVAHDPIKNEFGWHVVKLEEKRLVPPPSFSEAHDQIQQDLLAACMRQTIADARSQLLIHRFNLDGTELEAAPKQNARPSGGTRSRR
jgi:peptidyl-prolyl cis-trans isomerase C